ncbi:MAG: glycosyltransferase [Candidatus Bipolaricaulota bacterium]|nr:glycosyltransferase [Candidatus Bipolaricaulota bacterium]MDW8127393.1 glycosyltransferase [Candidatus Bipolaricaulota bacterium]
MKRLILVVTGLDLGGAENQVVHLAKRLQRRGWDVWVLSLRPPGVLAKELHDARIPAIFLGIRSRLGAPFGALRLIKMIRRLKPHIVHAHMFHANLLCRLVRPFAPVPVLVCTAHSTYEAPSSAKCPQEVTWREWAYRLTDPLCDLTTQVSRAGLARYLAVKAVSPYKALVVYNGIDTAFFQPDQALREKLRRELGVGNTFVWLSVGRLEPQKDHHTLLRAFALLGAYEATLIIVGEGRLRHELEELANSLGLDDRVRFLGRRQDIPALMNAADAFVLSSVWEGFPLVLVEALACGLPVVATDSGGPRELLDEERVGYLVQPKDPTALAQAMRLVMELSPTERQRMGERGRRHILNRFDLDSIVNEWDALYTHLLAHAKGRPKRWAKRTPCLSS